ncbi:DUF2971 domain-containing protein [Rathayibacter rathayi]|uniref:DUF2971 domain-containing protein n=1 Tax=Rathayibacter rathayi TaxID=33887 RepID=UPI000BC5B4A0|nr:DUF2971 domain-containing protein [Rathayibacter rathayi]MWV76018.1 DUF2971 domain-containing protein [Rathayibacter rathayi NCPPB 2980 = VKM Ac-1601]SOE06036.1 Protein of unknown function [Rathayibacter rathayi NCPPB 2980 = VKM Ac-1601]
MSKIARTPIELLRDEQLVWHYTDLNTLQLILESNTLLATEVNYQNDPREPTTAIEAVEDALRDLGAQQTYASFARAAVRWFNDYRSANGFISGRSGELIGQSRFIFCASTDPDNLYAWRTYSAGSRTGCAVGLDPNTPFGIVGENSGSATVEMSRWSTVIYDRMKLRQFATDKLRLIAEEWNKENEWDQEDAKEQKLEGLSDHQVSAHRAFGVLISEFSEVVAEIAAVAKHPSFADERETRLTSSNLAKGIVFSPGSNGPRPRVRLAAAGQWGSVVARAKDPLPIRALVLAPDARDQAATTAHWLLYANDYPIDPVPEIDESGSEPFLYQDSSRMVTVYRSEHPYRNV